MLQYCQVFHRSCLAPRAVEAVKIAILTTIDAVITGEKFGEIMQQSISVMLEQLKSSDPVAREAAIRALGESRDPVVVNPLKQIQTSDPDPALRELAGRYVQQSPIQLTQSPTLTPAPAAPAGKSSGQP